MEFFFMWARSSMGNRVDIDSRSWLIQASACQFAEPGSLSSLPYCSCAWSI